MSNDDTYISAANEPPMPNVEEFLAACGRLRAQRQAVEWPGASEAVLSPVSPLVLPAGTPDAPLSVFLYGLPVRLDESLPPNEIRPVGRDGVVARIVNIGQPDLGSGYFWISIPKNE